MCGLVFVWFFVLFFIWFWACVMLCGWTVWFAVQILCALGPLRFGAEPRFGAQLRFGAEPRFGAQPYATLAQLVERSFRKAQVASSSLAGGFFRIGHFRRQNRLMESRMSSAGLDQRNGVGESLGAGAGGRRAPACMKSYRSVCVGLVSGLASWASGGAGTVWADLRTGGSLGRSCAPVSTFSSLRMTSAPEIAWANEQYWVSRNLVPLRLKQMKTSRRWCWDCRCVPWRARQSRGAGVRVQGR